MSDEGTDDKQALVPAESAVPFQILDEIFEAEDPQPLVVAHLRALRPDQDGSPLRHFLQSTWSFLEGIRVIREEQDFAKAKALHDAAADGFQQLHVEDLVSIAKGFSLFSSAVIEARNLNLNQALKLFADTEEYLKNAGRFGRKYEFLVDHMKPESLFMGSLPALLAGDVDSARAAVKQSAAAGERVAEKYHAKGTDSYYTVLGFAHFYRAFFSFYQAQSDLTNLELDKIISEDVTASARTAAELLARGELNNKAVETSLHVARALVELLEVSQQLAAQLQLCLRAAFKPDLQRFLELKTKVRRAIDHASNAGPQALPLVRSCNALLIRIQNLEQLAKPRKADFGIYSGLISAALFVPLLLIASWANNAYATGLDGKTLFASVLALALIGGFGFGALRFKSLFLPSKDDGK